MKFWRTLFVCVGVFVWTFEGWGDEPLVITQAIGTPDLEFDGYVRSIPNAVTLKQWYLKNRVAPSIRETLMDTFDEAKLSLLKKRRDRAIASFRKITDTALSQDWTEGERGLIFDSFLYVASLLENPNERLAFVRRAIQFDWHSEPLLGFGDDINQLWKSAQAELLEKGMTWKPPEIFKMGATLLINGREVTPEVDGSVRIPSGRHRITIITNTYAPITAVIETADLAGHEFIFEPFFDGTCERPRSVREPLSENLKAVFLGTCTRDFVRGHWASRELELNPQKYSQAPQNPLDQVLASEAPLSPSRPFWQRPWFWISLGAIAGGFILYKTQIEKHDAEPTGPRSDSYSALIK